jgi:hypothetical protein
LGTPEETAGKKELPTAADSASTQVSISQNLT